MTASSLNARVIIAIAVTILAWASAFIVIRGTAPWFSGGSIALGRLLVGTVLLSFMIIGRRWIAPTAREWLLIAGFGLAWFGAYNVALGIAERTLDAGTTSMIVNVAPILIALGAGVFLREGIPRWLAVGSAVAFAGVILIGVGAGTAQLGDGSGVLWCIAAACTYTLGVLFQKPAIRRLPNAQVTWLGCAIGMLACLPFAPTLVGELQAAPLLATLGVVYLGAVPTALAFSTWAYALSRMPAGQLGVSTYIVPPLVVVLGFLVFAEVPVFLGILGGALCLVGVALSRKRSPILEPAKTLAE